MTLFFTLLPVYLFGNIHCAGMCGPLMALLNKNQYKWAYFIGRLTSYSLAGLLSAEVGMLLFHTLAKYHLSALLSLLFGAVIFTLALFTLLHLPYPGSRWLARKTGRLTHLFSHLLKLYGPYPLFLFGVCTLLLPCGQTLVVFSACALEAKPLTGLFNGFIFALLTSPSLLLSLTFLRRIKRHHLWMGGATLLVGVVAILRGIADFDLIPHLIVNPSAPLPYHIVLY